MKEWKVGLNCCKCNFFFFEVFCKNLVDGKWYEFDDFKVKSMVEVEVKIFFVYLLFYQRKGVMNSVREDLEIGYYWIYKLYFNVFKSVIKNLNRNFNNLQLTENIID